uniref:tRNA pseudouridine synthase n=1 Tax=Panagrolaimus sp. ES5 TaxID=591445 RepID=A0AC34FJL3_9BILA
MEQLLNIGSNGACKDKLENDSKKSKNVKYNKVGRTFDFSKFPRRRIALLFLYLGWDYDGLVTQDHTSNTIEQEILDTMIRTKLIESKEAAKWSRCGRTDKGVSGFRQVGSVTVRSTDVTGEGVFWPEGSAEEMSRIKSTNELRYDNILNNELPDTIRVIAWAPAAVDFNARFDCISRSYVYLFPRAQLNIANMQHALNAMIGLHDFRNFCRIDMNKSRIDTSYVREIFEANITPLDDQSLSSPYQMFQLKVRGSGFLWHQIRCIVSVVYDIGKGAEDVTLVPKLLDISSCPAKPQYTMAKDLPLCFFDASYANNSFDWKSHINGDVLQRLFTSLETKWCELETKAALVKTMMNELKGYGASDDHFEGIHTHITGIRSVKSKAHIPILKRPTCDSLETKISKFAKKRKLSENDICAE